MTLVRLKRALLRGVAEGLERWSAWLMGHADSTQSPQPETDEPANTVEPLAAQPENDVPEDWARRVYREPPADWVEKVRRGAPELLEARTTHTTQDNRRPVAEHRPLSAGEQSPAVKRTESAALTKQIKRGAQKSAAPAAMSQSGRREAPVPQRGEGGTSVVSSSGPSTASSARNISFKRTESVSPSGEIEIPRRRPIRLDSTHSQNTDALKLRTAEGRQENRAELRPSETDWPGRRRTARITPPARAAETAHEQDELESVETSGPVKRRAYLDSTPEFEAKHTAPARPDIRRTPARTHNASSNAKTDRAGMAETNPVSPVFVQRSAARRETSSAPAAVPQEQGANRWLDLPDPPSASNADEWASLLRERDRLQRLDREQRGLH